MMESLIRVVNFNGNLLHKMLDGVDDDCMCEQPESLCNHPAWIVGHLAYVRFAILRQQGSIDAALPEEWLPLFGRNSTPESDRAKYPSKADLVGAYDRLQAATVKLLEELTPAELAGPHKIESFRATFPTLQDLLVQMLAAHDGLHAGQLIDWRRARGLPRIM